MTMSKLKFSVIVPTFKDWDRLRLCLDALAAQDFNPIDFEVIVANNDASDVKPDNLLLPANTKMILAPEPGSYAARNAAISIAQGQILAFTDSDCIPEVQWLSAAYTAFEKEADLSRVSGPVTLFAEDGKWSAAALYDRTFMLRQQKSALKGQAATANTMARREVFDAVGLFGEGLLTGGDNEWSLRAQNAGFTLKFCPDVIVAHPARKTFGMLLRKVRRFEGGKIAKKRANGQRIIFPRLQYLIVPVHRIGLLLKQKDLTFFEAIRVWGILYALRLCSLVEQIRLIFWGSKYERR